MIQIPEFEKRFASLLRDTHSLLISSNLTVHPAVSRVILHGSRGPANKYRLESDIDLSLIVEPGRSQPDEPLLHHIFDTTKNSWQGKVDLDLAVIFDVRQCGLVCFDHIQWTDSICTQGGVDCFGLYKIGKGFNGLVKDAGIQVKLMYPCIKIWQRN